MNTSITKRARYRLLTALLLVGWHLVSCESLKSTEIDKKMVIHTSMDIYLIDVDSMTVKTGSSDTVYRFNNFPAMAVFVMDRTREEVSENRAYWLELNRKYNENIK